MIFQIDMLQLWPCGCQHATQPLTLARLWASVCHRLQGFEAAASLVSTTASRSIVPMRDVSGPKIRMTSAKRKLSKLGPIHQIDASLSNGMLPFPHSKFQGSLVAQRMLLEICHSDKFLIKMLRSSLLQESLAIGLKSVVCFACSFFLQHCNKAFDHKAGGSPV